MVSPSIAVEDRVVLRGIVQDHAVVGDRNAVFAVGEDITRARELLRPQAVDVRRVGDLDDLVRLHDVTANPGHPRIGLVVDEEVAPVIGPVGKGHMGMVRIAIQPGAGPGLAVRVQVLLGLRQQAVGEDLDAFVGIAPAGGAAAVEDRNAHQLAHGGDADDAHLTSLSRTPESVVLIQLARRDVRYPFSRRMGRAREDSRQSGCAGTGRYTTDTGQRCHLGGTAQQIPARDAGVDLIFV